MMSSAAIAPNDIVVSSVVQIAEMALFGTLEQLNFIK